MTARREKGVLQVKLIIILAALRNAPTPVPVAIMSDAIESQLIQHFLPLGGSTSQSDATSSRLPSARGPQQLADMLSQELFAIGLNDILVDKHAIVTAVKRGHCPVAPFIGFIAHLDTVDMGLSPDIHPQRLHFAGEDLGLNPRQDLWMLPPQTSRDLALCRPGHFVQRRHERARRG